LHCAPAFAVRVDVRLAVPVSRSDAPAPWTEGKQPTHQRKLQVLLFWGGIRNERSCVQPIVGWPTRESCRRSPSWVPQDRARVHFFLIFWQTSPRGAETRHGFFLRELIEKVSAMASSPACCGLALVLLMK